MPLALKECPSECIRGASRAFPTRYQFERKTRPITRPSVQTERPKPKANRTATCRQEKEATATTAAAAAAATMLAWWEVAAVKAVGEAKEAEDDENEEAAAEVLVAAPASVEPAAATAEEVRQYRPLARA